MMGSYTGTWSYSMQYCKYIFCACIKVLLYLELTIYKFFAFLFKFNGLLCYIRFQDSYFVQFVEVKTSSGKCLICHFSTNGMSRKNQCQFLYVKTGITKHFQDCECLRLVSQIISYIWNYIFKLSVTNF